MFAGCVCVIERERKKKSLRAALLVLFSTDFNSDAPNGSNDNNEFFFLRLFSYERKRFTKYRKFLEQKQKNTD